MPDFGLDGLVVRMAIGLGLGLLIGLERERTEDTIAGLRTFALIALLGGVSGALASQFGGWVLAGGFVGVTAMVLVGNLTKLRAGVKDPGITTEIAILLVYSLGAFLTVGSPALGIVLGGTVAVLLHAKDQLHRVVARLGDQDVAAIMRFVLIALVVLPVLPNRTFGPLDVLNPRQVWMMVVLIVGIGLGGYVGYKVMGSRAGTALAGILGGVISSTATTVSYARRSRDEAESSRLAAVIIMIASAIVFVRVLVEIGVVAPASLRTTAPPLLFLLLVFVALSVLAWYRIGSGPAQMPRQENPTQLASAIVFGLLYGLILLASEAGRVWLGDGGLYLVAAISGLVNLDAITLSTAHLTQAGRVAPEVLWKVVTVGTLANLAFKLVIAGVLGGRRLVQLLLPYYVVGGAVAAVLILAWPGA